MYDELTDDHYSFLSSDKSKNIIIQVEQIIDEEDVSNLMIRKADKISFAKPKKRL